MRRTKCLLSCFVLLLVVGCAPIRHSIYKRFELPRDLDRQTEQQVFLGVVAAMRSQPFVDELKRRFPSVTQSQLLKTDIRWDVFKSGKTRVASISFGVKDTAAFPEAREVVDFALEYGSNHARLLIENGRKQKSP